MCMEVIFLERGFLGWVVKGLRTRKSRVLPCVHRSRKKQCLIPEAGERQAAGSWTLKNLCACPKDGLYCTLYMRMYNDIYIYTYTYIHTHELGDDYQPEA